MSEGTLAPGRSENSRTPKPKSKFMFQPVLTHWASNARKAGGGTRTGETGEIIPTNHI